MNHQIQSVLQIIRMRITNVFYFYFQGFGRRFGQGYTLECNGSDHGHIRSWIDCQLKAILLL